jgi:hypothetical protein
MTIKRSEKLDIIIRIQIIYSFLLGIYTLTHYIHSRLYEEEDWDYKHLNSMREEDMMAEEAKELIGLNIVILLLSILHQDYFLTFNWPLNQILLTFGIIVAPFIGWALVEYTLTRGGGEC